MKAGMTFTIEPAISQGTRSCLILEDGWTAITEDGSRAAQFESTVLITDTGVEILTEWDGKQIIITYTKLHRITFVIIVQKNPRILPKKENIKIISRIWYNLLHWPSIYGLGTTYLIHGLRSAYFTKGFWMDKKNRIHNTIRSNTIM